MMADRAYLERMALEFTHKGRLIEAGWIGFRLSALPLDMPAEEIDRIRNAFLAGAQHTFGSVMVVLDPAKPPTEDDVTRISLIARELKGFMADFTKDHNLDPEKPREHLRPH